MLYVPVPVCIYICTVYTCDIHSTYTACTSDFLVPKAKNYATVQHIAYIHAIGCHEMKWHKHAIDT